MHPLWDRTYPEMLGPADPNKKMAKKNSPLLAWNIKKTENAHLKILKIPRCCKRSTQLNSSRAKLRSGYVVCIVPFQLVSGIPNIILVGSISHTIPVNIVIFPKYCWLYPQIINIKYHRVVGDEGPIKSHLP